MVAIQYEEAAHDGGEIKLHTSRSAAAGMAENDGHHGHGHGHGFVHPPVSFHNGNYVPRRTVYGSKHSRSDSSSSFLDARNDVSIDSSTATNSTFAEEAVADLMSQIVNVADCRKLTLVRHGARHHSADQFYCVNSQFPVTTLTTILLKAKRMVCVELCRLRLVGSLDDFHQLAAAIESQEYLQAFSLEGCRLQRGLAKQKALEPVMQALASRPHIVDITLIADKHASLGSLTPETVAVLGQSLSLQILRLEKMQLQDEHVVALSETLVINKTLQNLRISCTVAESGSLAIVHVLEGNTNLQKMDIVLEMVPHENLTFSIARALQSSQSLRTYNLEFGTWETDHEFVKEVQEEVKRSKALAKELEFSSASLSNCPFIRLMNSAIDASLYLGNLACSENHHRTVAAGQ